MSENTQAPIDQGARRSEGEDRGGADLVAQTAPPEP
jgi:hypothetical protein